MCLFFGAEKTCCKRFWIRKNKQSLNAITLTRNVCILCGANGAINGEHARSAVVHGFGQADVGDRTIDGPPRVSLSPAPERDYARSRHHVRREPCESRQVGRLPPITLLLEEPLLVRHSQVASVMCVC